MQAEGRTETGSIIHSRRLLLFGWAAGIIALDQLTKAIANACLASGEIVKPFGGDLVWLVNVQNRGLAFGMTFIPPLALTIISAAAGLILAYALYKSPLQPLWQSIPFTLIMAGAFGNMIDRMIYGQVTDFVSIDFPDFIMDRFAVFNVADSSISVGVVLLIIGSFLHPPGPETAASDQSAVPADEASSERP